MKTIIISLGVLCTFAFFAHAQDVTKAAATLEPKSGSQVTGTVTFTKTGDEVHVVADFQNLKPGKHFNPMHQHHDGPTGTERHAGDFGNVEADASGKGHLEWKGKLDLSGPNSIIGKSVIVHEKEDDLKTDPAGNSGARFACGVIHAAE
jgi:Cu-Zn family superoxide dismutase